MVSRSQKLLNRAISGDSSPNPCLMVDRMVAASKRCDFDAISFNYLIVSYARAGRIENAIEAFRRTLENGLLVDVKARNDLLKALLSSNSITVVWEFYREMEGNGLELDVRAFDIMMNACLKDGNPDESEVYFKEMVDRD
uniref:Pentatricopeptide repeat-containing protein-mitochondrial domain-containing protein n=1 Tax=Ananas comosus var. bracteatus TaxID=296719 RepID=A0A6V7QWF9_ANACO